MFTRDWSSECTYWNLHICAHPWGGSKQTILKIDKNHHYDEDRMGCWITDIIKHLW